MLADQEGDQLRSAHDAGRGRLVGKHQPVLAGLVRLDALDRGAHLQRPQTSDRVGGSQSREVAQRHLTPPRR
ncbi:MAG: hypothetical protein ABSG43_10555 [Solirubrobacteraceae bacterium]